MQDDENFLPTAPKQIPWNKGKLTGAKPPLRSKHVWSIRTKLLHCLTRSEMQKRACSLLARLSLDSRSFPWNLFHGRWWGIERRPENGFGSAPRLSFAENLICRFSLHVGALMGTMDNKLYGPVWRCVYCGNDDASTLSREHIIAKSLGGRGVIQKASCPACAEITREFELTCARTLFGPLRILMNMPTRHKHERPTELPVDFDIDGTRTTKMMKIEDHPGVQIPRPLYDLPGIVGNRPVTDSFGSNLQYRHITATPKDFDARIRRAFKDVPESSTVFPIKPPQFPHEPFARMLAKIAHCWAVAEFGIDSFEPMLPQYILGKKKTLPFLVGTTPDPLPSSNEAASKGMHLMRGARYLEDTYFGAAIQLFAPLKFPWYLVIVGKPNASIAKRLREARVLLDL